ncbi:MAG: SymE family type I addiction module toxin [Alcanivorax sp.]|nr:MAG: SymE family type I addiction module toxin [Alcanivorax sp.]
MAPFILLEGLWLEQAGFSIDTPVSIRLRMGGCRLFEIVAAEAERRASESFEALPPNAEVTGTGAQRREPNAAHS